MALLSSGCRATVEGLPNVQNSSTTQQWQSYLAGWQLHVPCRQKSKHFHFRSIKSYSVIPLFRIPRFTASLFYRRKALTPDRISCDTAHSLLLLSTPTCIVSSHAIMNGETSASNGLKFRKFLPVALILVRV